MRAPAAVSRAGAARHGRTVHLSFVSPGDDLMSGRPAAYRLTWTGGAMRVNRTLAGGRREQLRLALPVSVRTVSVRAIDSAGNVGPVISVQIRRR